MTPKEMIEVLQAFEAGKHIQVLSQDKWLNASEPCWNFTEYKYRVKPEPMVIWVNVYDNNGIEVFSHLLEREAKASCRHNGKTIKFIQVDE